MSLVQFPCVRMYFALPPTSVGVSVVADNALGHLGPAYKSRELVLLSSQLT